jgi:hypothetical protein
MPTDLERRHGLRRQAAAIQHEVAAMRGHMRRLEKAGDSRAVEMHAMIDASINRSGEIPSLERGERTRQRRHHRPGGITLIPSHFSISHTRASSASASPAIMGDHQGCPSSSHTNPAIPATSNAMPTQR